MSKEWFRLTAGEYIMLNRKRAGLSQRELAAKCGLSNQCISLLESGKSTNPTVRTITEIARGLDGVIGWSELFVRFQDAQYEAERDECTEEEPT